MQRAAIAAKRVVATPVVPRVRTLIRKGHDEAHGHHDHHDHRTFEAPFNVMGAPLGVAAFTVFGGLGTVYLAYRVQFAKWQPPK